jgi:phosphatidate phosphatase APP1
VTLVDPETDEPISNATVIVTLPNGSEVEGTTDENGTVEIPVDLPVGDNNITVTYPGDETYNGTNTTVAITVGPRESITDAEVNNNVVGNVTIDVTVTDAETGLPVPNGPVSIIVNDTVVGTGDIVDGKATIITTISTSGIMDIDVIYEGNENYTESEKLLNDVEIVPKDSQLESEQIGHVINDTSIKVTLTDEDTGKPIANETIEILYNGTVIAEGITNDDGELITDINLPAGNYTLDIVFEGNSEYANASSQLDVEVNKRDANINNTVSGNNVGNNTIESVITDSQTGAPVVDAKVVLTLEDGTQIESITDSEGKATFNVTLVQGTNDFNVTLVENPIYNEALSNISVETSGPKVIIIGNWTLVRLDEPVDDQPNNDDNNQNDNNAPAVKKPVTPKVNKYNKNTQRNANKNSRYGNYHRYGRYNNYGNYNKRPSWYKPSTRPSKPVMTKAQYRLFITLYAEFFEGDISFSDLVAILKLNGIEIDSTNAWDENGVIIIDYDNLEDVPDTIEIHDNSGHIKDSSYSIDKNYAPSSSGEIDSGNIEVVSTSDSSSSSSSSSAPASTSSASESASTAEG